MSDFIIIQNINDIPNYQDFQDLSSLASQINQTCGINHKYIGMHLSERILYLTYYIKYGFSQARCYKIDIQIEKGLDGKPTGDYVVGFKRQSNDPIGANECSNIISSSMLNSFNAKGACVQGGNCIPLGNYDSATLCCNMQNFISQLTNAGGAIQ